MKTGRMTPRIHTNKHPKSMVSSVAKHQSLEVHECPFPAATHPSKNLQLGSIVNPITSSVSATQQFLALWGHQPCLPNNSNFHRFSSFNNCKFFLGSQKSDTFELDHNRILPKMQCLAGSVIQFSACGYQL
jgi:hypothetical protein